MENVVAAIRRVLRNWVPQMITGFFAADLTGLAYYVNFVSAAFNQRRVSQLANAALDGQAVADRVQILNMDAHDLKTAAGLPAFRGSPYGQLLPSPPLAGLVEEAQNLVFGIGEQWLPIINDSYFGTQNYVFNNVMVNNGAEFMCRFRLKGTGRTNLSLYANLANAIAAVHRRMPLLKFRILFYSQYVQSTVMGSGNSREFTGRDREREIAGMILNVLQGFMQQLADGEGGAGSDPAVIPGAADEDAVDIDPENLLQNCGVVFIPRRVLQAAGPDLTRPPPQVVKVILDGVPTTLRVIDATNPKFGRGELNCVIEGVAHLLDINPQQLVTRLPPDPTFSVRQVLNKLLPHMGSCNHVTINDAGDTVLDHGLNMPKNNNWLLTHCNHVYQAQLVKEKPKEVKMKKAKDDVYDFRFVTFDFETRAQVYDNGESPTTGKLTGTALAVTSAAVAYRDVDGEIKTWCDTLDPDVFECDLADEERKILDQIEEDRYVAKLTGLSHGTRKQMALKCFQLYKDCSDDMKRAKIEKYIRFQVNKQTKTVYRADKNFNNVMKTLNSRRRIIFNQAYSKSRNQPVYKMLDMLATLPYALGHKEKQGYVNCYAHNGSGFDFYLVLGPLVHLWRDGSAKIDSIIMKPGRLMNINVSFLTGARYRFLCTYAHLSDTLAKLCKSFNLPPELQKLATVELPDGKVMNTMDLCLMERDLDPCGYIRMMKERNYLAAYERYNIMDCIALVHIVEKTALMYGQLLGDAIGSAGFNTCQEIFRSALSASSASMGFYKENLKRTDMEMSEAFTAQSQISEADWVHDKKAIYGGASISNQRGLHYQSLVVLDQRSQYPHALSTCLFTLGAYVDFGDTVSYVKKEDGTYVQTGSGGQCLRPIDWQFMPGHPCYFKSGNYVITGAFDRTNRSKYHINGLPVRIHGVPLNWYAEEIDEPQHVGWYDLNRLVAKKELKWFTIWPDSKVAGPDCEIVPGARLFAPYLTKLMEGKNAAEKAGNMVLRTLYKLAGNGFSGKLQMKIHHKKIIPERDATIGFYRSEESVSYYKSNVRFAVEFLGGVRLNFFNIVDSLPPTIPNDPISGRVFLVFAETDSYGIPAPLIPYIQRFIGDKLGDLVYEVTSSSQAIFFAPKTYCITGKFFQQPLVKMAAKGLPRKLVTPQFYMDLYCDKDVTINMPMLTRDAKTLTIIDKQHATRTTKSTQTLPVFTHFTDVLHENFPYAFPSADNIEPPYWNARPLQTEEEVLAWTRSYEKSKLKRKMNDSM